MTRLSTLPLLILSTGLFGFTAGSCGPGDEPTPCQGNQCHPTPLACQSLDEAGCLSRTDCQADYQVLETRCETASPDVDDAPRCGTTTRAFTGCSPVVCPAIMCDLACGHGLARDARGCDVCACSPVPCSSDAQCPAGELCLFPAQAQCAGTRCATLQGFCGPVGQPGCGTDAECAPGEHCVFPQFDCPPGALCAPPPGVCKPNQGCQLDTDCGIGKYCEHFATCASLDCPPVAPGGLCLDRAPCTDASQCGAGQVCAMDPSDPCTKQACASFRAAPTYCQPACGGLGELACLARADCEAIWATPGAGESDKRAPFVACKPVGCAPVTCALFCDNGFAQDASGCAICACNPSGCRSDAECLPGQSCVFEAYDCADADCGKPYLEGTCQFVSKGCQVDAECATGERCEVAVYDFCPEGEVCPPLYGTCVPARCQSDAECRAGETCVYLLTGEADRFCDPADPTCGTWGVCQRAGCQSDTECGPGERCEIPSTYCGGPDGGEGGGTGGCIGPTVGTCVPANCRADADCRPGESCIFLMVQPACDVDDPMCGYVGVCNAVPPPCASDADCKANEQCQILNCGPGTNCGGPNQCVPRPACKTDAECRTGESCQPDPTDPCNDGSVVCFAPGATICLPILPPKP